MKRVVGAVVGGIVVGGWTWLWCANVGNPNEVAVVASVCGALGGLWLAGDVRRR